MKFFSCCKSNTTSQSESTSNEGTSHSSELKFERIYKIKDIVFGRNKQMSSLQANHCDTYIDDKKAVLKNNLEYMKKKIEEKSISSFECKKTTSSEQLSIPLHK